MANGSTRFTKENAKEMGRKGGIVSGEVRREKKDVLMIADAVLGMGMKSGSMEDFKSLEDAKGKNLSVGQSIFLQQTLKALKGDTRAAEFVFNYAGQKPIERQEISAEIEADDELTNILNLLEEFKDKE